MNIKFFIFILFLLGYKQPIVKIKKIFSILKQIVLIFVKKNRNLFLRHRCV